MATKKVQKTPVSKTNAKAKPTARVGGAYRTNPISMFSTKRVLIVFVIAFAIIGGLIIHFSHAAVDPAVDAAQSNQKAYEAIKASAASAGVTLTPPKTIKPKPADFGQVKTVDPTHSAEKIPAAVRAKAAAKASAGAAASATDVGPTGVPIPADLPAFPELPKNVKPLSDTGGSWLEPKAYADDWSRAYTVYYAQQFMGWRGKDFFAYGTFPNGDNWCSDFMSYITMRAGKPFWTGYDGWRIPFSGDVANLMYNTGSLRSRDSTPVPGDFVFFNWGDGGTINDHIGLVESVDGKGNIHTIEGNIGSRNQWESVVGRNTWAGNDWHILAYGHWW